MSKPKLWCVLVPKNDNNSNPYAVRHHQKFDDFVLDRSGGITINRSSQGTWITHNGKQDEPMIPVYFLSSKKQAESIVKFARKHYSQKCIMWWVVSKNVRFCYD